ncbi:MAG: ABC transporter [Anaerolineaceae bacterium]|nr:ABC transporter [Anaerolineaceae bacterium]
MKRLWYTVLTDIQLQWRNGFYAVMGITLFFWVLLRTQAGNWDLNWLMGVFVIGNILITSFYFIAGLVLLERDEGTLTAQAVTPLRPWEYLFSKGISLFILAFVENLVIVVLYAGFDFNWLVLILGLLLSFLLYLFCGLIMITRYASINGFLMPSVLAIGIITIPVIAYVVHWNHWLLYLHPMQAILMVLNGAFIGQNPSMWIYGFSYSILTVIGLSWLAYQVTRDKLYV